MSSLDVQRLLARLPAGFTVQRVGQLHEGWFAWLLCPDGVVRLYDHQGHGWVQRGRRWLTGDEIVAYIVEHYTAPSTPVGVLL